MSIQQKVNNRVQRLKRGTPFSISGFYKLGTRTAVQTALSRLVKTGEIVRVAKGYYSRPKSLKALPNLTITASTTEVAQLWAKEHNYKLVAQGMTAANKLGLQTQMPVRTILWTNGPSRTFKKGNSIVEVRRTGKSKLIWANKIEGEIFRGLLAVHPSSIKSSEMPRIFERTNISEAHKSKVVEKLVKQPLLSAWQSKLEGMELQST